MRLLRVIGFVIFFPFNVVVTLPWVIRLRYPAEAAIGAWRWIGILIGAVGALVFAWSVILFWLRGQGTPTVWFLKRFRWVIGDETTNLVSSALYRYSRNPMYVGVLSMVFAQAVWFGSEMILWYFGLLNLIFNAFIRVIEEPHLRKKYGAEYEAFCRRVPRWIGIPKA